MVYTGALRALVRKGRGGSTPPRGTSLRSVQAYVYSKYDYFVYILECSDKSFYIGKTTNIEKINGIQVYAEEHQRRNGE